MFSMQINVFAVIHTDVMAKVMKMIAVLVVQVILPKHAEEHGEIQFTKQKVCSSNFRIITTFDKI